MFWNEKKMHCDENDFNYNGFLHVLGIKMREKKYKLIITLITIKKDWREHNYNEFLCDAFDVMNFVFSKNYFYSQMISKNNKNLLWK